MDIGTNLLKTLGMNQMQAQVYLAALELGEATIQALARKSCVNRSTIYTFIDDLKDRGYILETRKNKRRVYSGLHPERLVEMQKNRAQELSEVVPELMAIYNKSDKKPRVTFYEGLQGIEDVYADMLRDKKEILAYENLEDLKCALPSRVFDWFPKERAHKDILIRTISRDTPFAREFSRHNRGLLRETKFIDTDKFKTDINIYGDKVALMDLQGDAQFAVLIENQNLADTMRVMWQKLWDTLGPVVE